MLSITQPRLSDLLRGKIELFSIDNRVTTVPGKRTRVTVDLARRDGKLVIVTRGRINPKSDFRSSPESGLKSGVTPRPFRANYRTHALQKEEPTQSPRRRGRATTKAR